MQLRFHTILEIETEKELVAQFQREVRKEFPAYQLETRQSFRLNLPQLIAQEEQQHRFTTQDGNSTLLLTREFLALEEREYKGHSDFTHKVELAIKALFGVFGEINGIRLGLRYINAINPAEISKTLGRKVDMDELIQKDFLHKPKEISSLDDTVFLTEMRAPVLSEPGFLVLRHGLIRERGQDTSIFRIDLDRYIESDVDVSKTVENVRAFGQDMNALFNSIAGQVLIEWMTMDTGQGVEHAGNY